MREKSNFYFQTKNTGFIEKVKRMNQIDKNTPNKSAVKRIHNVIHLHKSLDCPCDKAICFILIFEAIFRKKEPFIKNEEFYVAFFLKIQELYYELHDILRIHKDSFPENVYENFADRFDQTFKSACNLEKWKNLATSLERVSTHATLKGYWGHGMVVKSLSKAMTFNTFHRPISKSIVRTVLEFVERKEFSLFCSDESKQILRNILNNKNNNNQLF